LHEALQQPYRPRPAPGAPHAVGVGERLQKKGEQRARQGSVAPAPCAPSTDSGRSRCLHLEKKQSVTATEPKRGRQCTEKNHCDRTDHCKGPSEDLARSSASQQKTLAPSFATPGGYQCLFPLDLPAIPAIPKGSASMSRLFAI